MSEEMHQFTVPETQRAYAGKVQRKLYLGI